MIKICDKSLLKPLILLFQNSAKLSYFPDIWKRSNIIPVHKKNDKQLVENYRPISVLPIFGKSFEKIIFNKIYHFLLEDRLLNPNQSGFRSSDFSINQLLAIKMKYLKHLTVIQLCRLDQSFRYIKST